MIRAVRDLWNNHRLLLVAFSTALAVTLFFSVRALLFFVYWSDPSHRNQPLEGWMTPGYIAHSYHLDRLDVAAMLGLDPEAAKRPTLDQIARQRGIPLSRLLDELSKALADHEPKE